MVIRRSLLALGAAAAFVLSACAGNERVSTPIRGGSLGAGESAGGGPPGFCEDFAGALSSDWPNIDQSTATELNTVVAEWAASPELSSIQGDIQVIGGWLTTAATSATPASPPPDVETAFQNITAFADANC